MKIDYHNALNSEQLAACFYSGSVLLVSCPGSGKTRTLTYRIAHELEKIDRNKYVVAITYTNNAADEITERIEELGVDTTNLWIGTIHSFCLEWILKPYSVYIDELRYGYSIINPYDSEDIITALCKDLKSPKINYYDCSYRFSQGEVYLQCPDKLKHSNIKLVIDSYHKYLEVNNKIDFELLLKYSASLIETYPNIARNLSLLFKCILVDEYQDTRDVQYDILNRIFSSGEGKVTGFYVGDPNQSIFTSLGGGAIKHEDLCHQSGLSFELLYLSTNYRSGSKIIDFFGGFKVFPSKLHPDSENLDKGFVSYNKSIHKSNLATEISRIINYVVYEKKIKQNEICIICPQWIPLASMTRELSGLYPEFNFNGPGMSPFGRDVENFWYKLCKLALTQPSPDLYMKRRRWSRDVIVHLGRCGYVYANGVSNFLRLINSISINHDDGVKYLESYFSEFSSKMAGDILSYTEIMDHYKSFFKSANDRIIKLKEKNITGVDTISYFRKVFQSKDGIVISTVHGAKGTEFDCIISYGLVEGMVPFFADPDQTGSAKKTLYVIGSRARKYIFMISEIDSKRLPTKVLDGYIFSYDKF
ncbi:ATP-dependent helicase [Rouxiella badensis]|uniref:ATP-dependent helicase n=1 Tax=Rouxiella badensis TaxID=1646377 RepID=UPI0028A94C5C|nr:ATP-dependent helicase [Rouxiella badensis]